MDCSTVAPGTTKHAAAHAAAAGASYVSAPVFGRPDVAAAGQLLVAVAGPGTVVEGLLPLLSAFGRKVRNGADSVGFPLSGSDDRSI